MAWGYQLILDCSGFNDGIESPDTIKKFMKELVKEIDMEAVGEPIIKYFPPKPDPKSGYTIIQLIVTSSIVCHFMDQDHTGYVDVFSCKDFKPDDVERIMKKYFGNKLKIKSRFIERTAPDVVKEDAFDFFKEILKGF
jgi:S-adenosylmethionine/arginine decarboxylase-like enzyme